MVWGITLVLMRVAGWIIPTSPEPEIPLLFDNSMGLVNGIPQSAYYSCQS